MRKNFLVLIFLFFTFSILNAKPLKTEAELQNIRNKADKIVQEELKNNSVSIYEFMPNLKFVVNGEETGPILDFIHDKNILDKLLVGETVEVILKDNYYLALGDNTDNSFDSRYWGFVKESRIRGRALVRFWPLNRIGLVK